MSYSRLFLSLLLMYPSHALPESYLFSTVRSAKNSITEFFNRINVQVWAYQNPFTGNTIVGGSLGYQASARPIDTLRTFIKEYFKHYKKLLEYHCVEIVKFVHENPKFLLFASSQIITLTILMLVIAKNIKLSHRLKKEKELWYEFE